MGLGLVGMGLVGRLEEKRDWGLEGGGWRGQEGDGRRTVMNSSMTLNVLSILPRPRFKLRHLLCQYGEDVAFFLCDARQPLQR